jgi:hypothetical protein
VWLLDGKNDKGRTDSGTVTRIRLVLVEGVLTAEAAEVVTSGKHPAKVWGYAAAISGQPQAQVALWQFGGCGTDSVANSLHVLEIKQTAESIKGVWTPVPLSGAPSARHSMAFAQDAAQEHLFIYGGCSPTFDKKSVKPEGGLFRLDCRSRGSAAWRPLQPGLAPAPGGCAWPRRWAGSLGFDPGSDTRAHTHPPALYLLGGLEDAKKAATQTVFQLSFSPLPLYHEYSKLVLPAADNAGLVAPLTASEPRTAPPSAAKRAKSSGKAGEVLPAQSVGMWSVAGSDACKGGLDKHMAHQRLLRLGQRLFAVGGETSKSLVPAHSCIAVNGGVCVCVVVCV